METEHSQNFFEHIQKDLIYIYIYIIYNTASLLNYDFMGIKMGRGVQSTPVTFSKR